MEESIWGGGERRNIIILKLKTSFVLEKYSRLLDVIVETISSSVTLPAMTV